MDKRAIVFVIDNAFFLANLFNLINYEVAKRHCLDLRRFTVQTNFMMLVEEELVIFGVSFYMLMRRNTDEVVKQGSVYPLQNVQTQNTQMRSHPCMTVD